VRPDTFGNTTAAVNLADILSQESFSKYGGYVSKFLSTQNRYFNVVIYNVWEPDRKSTARGILNIIYNEGRIKLKASNLPLKIISHTLNLYAFSFRKAMRTLEETKRDACCIAADYQHFLLMHDYQ
jgi:hypothetical protein